MTKTSVSSDKNVPLQLTTFKISYRSNLPLLFMVRKRYAPTKVQLKFLTMKGTGKFGW